MKRFYKDAAVSAQDGVFSVVLDGRPVRTPGGKKLAVPCRAVAAALAQEWNAQEREILPETMPLTQLVTTMLDIIAGGRERLTSSVLGYLDTDLLCYRAQQPEKLVERQKEFRDPWLNWFEKKFGERLETTEGLKALKQPAAAHEKVAVWIGGLDDGAFTILQAVTALAGSLILALAFTDGAASPAQVYQAVHVEESLKAEIYNEELYGPDPQQEKRQKAVMRDLEAAVRFLALARES